MHANEDAMNRGCTNTNTHAYVETRTHAHSNEILHLLVYYLERRRISVVHSSCNWLTISLGKTLLLLLTMVKDSCHGVGKKINARKSREDEYFNIIGDSMYKAHCNVTAWCYHGLESSSICVMARLRLHITLNRRPIKMLIFLLALGFTNHRPTSS